MSEMLLNLLYLALNVCCLGVLVSAKYYRIWGFLCAQLAVTCWQIIVLLFVPVSDRTMAIRYWLTGDIALVVLCGLAVLEVLWRSMRGFPTAHKVGVCIYSCVGMHFAGLSMRWLMGIPTHADWIVQYRSDRMMANLCIATLAIIAAGVAHSFNRDNDPRFVRFHGTIVAVLACGHVLLSDMTHWSEARAAYRMLEVACCFGWMINANLTGKEERLVQRWFSLAPDRNASAPYRAARPALGDSPAPVLRRGFGYHRSAATVPVVCLPAVHAETQ